MAAVLLVVSLTTSAHADDRLNEISKLILSGRAAEAKPQIEAAVTGYRAASDKQGEAVGLLLLAFADVALENQASARKNLDLAAEKLAATGDRYSAWMAMLFGAGLDMGERKWASAADRHQAALAVLRETDDTPFSLDAFIALGPMFGMDMGPMAPLLQGQPEFVKPFFMRMAEMISRDALGTTYIELGEYEKADDELTRAGDLSAAFFGMFDASVAAHVGDLRRRQWKLDEARKSYKKALGSVNGLPILSFLPADWPELRILEQLAEIELLSGRIDAALQWNDRARQLVAKRKDPSREAWILDDRATLLMRTGRFSDALRVLAEARALAEGAKNTSLVAWLSTQQGAIQMYSGDYGAAARTLEGAIDLYQKVNEPDDEGYAWSMLSQVYIALSADDSADMALARVRELAKKSKYPTAQLLADMITKTREKLREGVTPEVALEVVDALCALPQVDSTAVDQIRGMLGMTDLVKGTQLARLGKHAEAREVFRKALEKTAVGDLRSGYLGAIAASYWNEGNAEEAITWFKKAVESMERPIESITDDELLASYLGSNRRWFYELTIEMLASTGRVDEAFDYTERARARAFLQLLGNHRLSPERGASDALMREAESLRVQIAEWERTGSPFPGDLGEARERYRLLLRRLKTSSPEYSSLTTVEPLRIDVVQQELPADATLVSYFTTTRGLHAWIIDRNGSSHVALKVDEAAMRRALCWARAFLPPGQVRGATPYGTCRESATGEELFALLVAPLRDRIHTRRLIVVPHGALHYIPFGALRDPESGRYLIDDFTITYAPSASSLRFLRSKETTVDGGALVIGSPDGSLPGAQREASVVARHVQTMPVVGERAAEHLLYELRGDVDIVHIGAHGHYVAASPIFSRIALAPGEGHDGNLEVHEILGRLDLSGVNLVVLSACQTALGERSGGDDVVGLTRAVLYAGSPGVISTLWDIDDDAAAVLMDELYCHLRNGAPAAVALREAQLALRRSGDYGDPRFWAAFILTGDPQGRWTH